MQIRIFGLIAASFLLAGCGNKADITPERDQLLQGLNDELPAGLSVDEIRDSVIPGLLEVRVGPQIYYATEDGKYIVSGAIIDREAEANLTAQSQAEVVQGMLAAVDRDKTHSYTPEGEVKRSVYVFTDPTCPYCQRFHSEIPALNAAGIEVVYLGFPRSGVGSDAYHQLTSAFCSKDKDAAFDHLMRDPATAIDSDRCLSPVDFHYDLAARLQVQGTPAVFDDRGNQIGGYLTSDQLLSALEG